MVVGVYYPSYLGGWGRRIAGIWEVEVAASRDCTTALQPGVWWQSEILPQKKTQKPKTKTNKQKNQKNKQKKPLKIISLQKNDNSVGDEYIN